MDKNAPIGVFDSGIGGISVLKQCIGLMPKEKYIFFGDDANCPYGEKTDDEIIALTTNAVKYLIDRGVKAVVIGCNTATATAVESVRNRFDLPIVGIEPAVKPALQQTNEGRILVMATPATVRQKKFTELVTKLDVDNRVDLMGCDGLAAAVEKDLERFIPAKEWLKNRFAEVDTTPYRAVVLGCTHYAFIADMIREMLPECKVFNGDIGEARHLNDILSQMDMLSDGPSETEFVFSGQKNAENEKKFEEFLKKYLRI